MIRELDFSVNSREILKECADLPWDTDTEHQSVVTIHNKGKNIHISDDSYTADIINTVNNTYGTNCATIRLLKPGTNYGQHSDNWRSDIDYSYHIVLKSDPQNYFCYPLAENRQMYAVNKTNTLYECNVIQEHSFINMSASNRIHLTFFCSSDIHKHPGGEH